MFKKGVSGNLSGRPKGAKGKRQQEWEQLGEFLTETGAQRVKAYMESLNDKEFFEKYKDLLNYFKPKMQSTSIDAKVEAKPIEYRNVSKEFKDEE
ncbi:MAG: hypothetical protein OEY89_01350 [Gammaproteobacteria bacterium]|nr:hypothetical protein [Gammaproteobacteria bacterium]